MALNNILFSTSNYMYSLIKLKSMPDHVKPLLLSTSLASIIFLQMKIDFILAEIKWLLSPFKIFYYLINNLKSNHKLNDRNFNRLAILSRLIQIVILNFGMSIIIISNVILLCWIAISTQNQIWIIQSVIYLPAFFNGSLIFCLSLCIVFVMFIYYKMRFHQINQQIKSLILNGKVISKNRSKKLLKLINEHNLVSIELNKTNLMIRRTAVAIFIIFSITKVNMVYFLFNFNNLLVKIVMFDGLITVVLFTFIMSYLFTQQIKSAHQSSKLIYSLVCRYKINLKFKLKVKRLH